MTKGETSSKKDAFPASSEPVAPRHRHRRHGYRGYPNGPSAGGDIHWGSGFGGIGAMHGPRGSSGILTERTRDHAARVTSEDETVDA